MVDVISEPIFFEWDKGNLDKSLKKHGVTNEEAEEVFFDNKSLLTEDIKHSLTEKRYQILGTADSGKLLSVIFTIRRKKVRIISARIMNRKERRFYEGRKEA